MCDFTPPGQSVVSGNIKLLDISTADMVELTIITSHNYMIT